MQIQPNIFRTQYGFTLLEILIALAISGVVMTGVYSAFKTQQDSYLAQDQIAEAQQNLRAAFYMLSSEIRTAGHDPNDTANAGITTATASRLTFTRDLWGGEPDGRDNDANGTVDDEPDRFSGAIEGGAETVTYGFGVGVDNEPDGIVDDLNGDGLQNDIADLGRDIGANPQRIAENIQSLEFFYTLNDGTQTIAPTAAQLDDIRAITVSLLARAENPDRLFTDTVTYRAASGALWGPFNDNFRRRFQTLTIYCRNMGL